MSVSTVELEKAIKALETALLAPKNELNRDATIQRFEFCIELSWKVSKKIMGTNTSAPKQVVREMAQNNLISDVELWLLAIDKRNESSHTYNETLAEEIYSFIKNFFPELTKLINKIK